MLHRAIWRIWRKTFRFSQKSERLVLDALLQIVAMRVYKFIAA
jgi:hypothetical protein